MARGRRALGGRSEDVHEPVIAAPQKFSSIIGLCVSGRLCGRNQAYRRMLLFMQAVSCLTA